MVLKFLMLNTFKYLKQLNLSVKIDTLPFAVI